MWKISAYNLFSTADLSYAEDENEHYFILVGAHSPRPEIYFMRQNTSATTIIAILWELFALWITSALCK